MPYHEVTLGVTSMVEKRFLKEVMNISIPVALQSMLQSSFSMIDQVMAGQPGDQSAAAVEIASRPGFIYAFLVSAISTIAAIMTSQYIGKNNREAEEKTLCINLLVMLIVGSCFLFSFQHFSRFIFISLFERSSCRAEGHSVPSGHCADFYSFRHMQYFKCAPTLS